LNRDFFNSKRYVWAAAEFYPYRLTNPKSSNPYLLYRDLYEPWRDRDRHDKFIAQTRVALIGGVRAQAMKGTLTRSEARRLVRICSEVDLLFFYPIIYRIDLTGIRKRRLKATTGSAALGSSEYL